MLWLEWQEEQWAVLAERAMFRERTATLFVADTHFGKDATFAASGIPVPPGTTADDLARLDAAIARTEARELVVLGDFFHSRESRSADTMALLRSWRGRNEELDCVLVPGNHDRHAGHPPEELGFRIETEPWELEGGIVARHHPEESPGRPALAGHLHPAVVLRDSDGSRLRMACFHIAPMQVVLPAFGSFTGTCEIAPAAGDRIVVVHEGGIAEVSVAPRGRWA